MYFLNSARAQNAVRRKETMPMKNCLPASSVLLTIAVILLFLNYSRLGNLFHSHVRDRPKHRLFLRPSDFSSRLRWRVPWLTALTATSRLFITFTLAARISTTSSGVFFFCWQWDFAG
jgi:hypothetical protein